MGDGGMNNAVPSSNIVDVIGNLQHILLKGRILQIYMLACLIRWANQPPPIEEMTVKPHLH